MPKSEMNIDMNNGMTFKTGRGYYYNLMTKLGHMMEPDLIMICMR